MLKTPVAFFIFNRPDLTETVFESIARVKPKTLFVIADGSRNPEEAILCQKTRAIVKKVDWDCELLTNFSESNLSCPIRLSSGLDWVFSKVEEAIIIEDDCLPNPSFFSFCENLLEFYREDERVMHVGGNNFQNAQSRTTDSYYFSKYTHIWGWATWKRAWEKYDFKMQTWPEFKAAGGLNWICEDKFERLYWQQIFDRCYNEKKFEWDYSWLYTCWTQNGLSIIPDVNLVSNIGFRADATYTRAEDSPFSNLPTQELREIKHPPWILPHREADAFTYDFLFGGKGLKQLHTIPGKLRWRWNNLRQQIRGASNS